MKKNLLFVMPSLTAGGGEKSLVNLLSQIDYKAYNVDLFLFSQTGVFINSLPKEVNILGFPNKYNIYTKGLKKSMEEFLAKGQVTLAYSRLMFTVMNRVIRNTDFSEQFTWKYQRKSLDTLEKVYDAAIGFLEKSSIYFVVDKVKARKKIGWIHTNYSDSGMRHHYDDPYFKQLDHIVTVSEECAKSLSDHFLHLNNKIKVIYNIVSPKMIHHLSNEDIDEGTIFDTEYTNIVTLARLSHEKGIDLAIESCKLLVGKGHNIRWYVLGDGQDRESLESLIEKHQLGPYFKLLGVKENPYPYIKKADIYVQPSRYEGKSIAIDEAKILQKPIVVTNFETAKDQIQHGINGVIVDLSPAGISQGIEKLMEDIPLKNRVICNLAIEKLGTEGEIRKLYEIL
ncbi:glycosyltransferase [Paenibacillus sp. UNC451MF]|uniref:glycosyltransferase n=1 Tax=Paenibacillus sp. UNC451MF TaxID=1449063 RepID=UPI00048FB23E|nr:glycosyltransferase [Paenibacillus sp. UNC451MF]